MVRSTDPFRLGFSDNYNRFDVGILIIIARIIFMIE